MTKVVQYEYHIFPLGRKYYVVLYRVDNGNEAGYMGQEGQPTLSSRLRAMFDTPEAAREQAVSWGHTL